MSVLSLSCAGMASCPAAAAAIPGTAFLVPGASLSSTLPQGLASGLASGVFAALAVSVSRSTGWLAGHLSHLVIAKTATGPSAAWSAAAERSMVSLALWVVVPMLAAATIGAIARQDLRRLGRIWAVGLPGALLADGLGTALVGTGIGVTDEMCRAVDPGGAHAVLTKVAGGLMNHGMPAFVTFVAAGVAALAALLLWLELVLRAAAITLAGAFMPLAFATVVWPTVAPVARRSVEVMTALLLSKFVVVATLSIGASALSAQRGGADAAVTGIALLLLAAFAPFAVLRLVPVIEAGAIGHLEHVSRRPARAVAGGVQAARRLGGDVAGAAGGGPPPVPADEITERTGDYLVAAVARTASAGGSAGGGDV